MVTKDDIPEEMTTSANLYTPEDIIKDSVDFRSMIMMYRCAIREVKTKLEVLDDEFSVKYSRNPISSIQSRIKSVESIYNKLKKLGYEFTVKNIQEQLNDVAGIRVICPFTSDIYSVAALLAEQDDITVLRIKDYIEHPKQNGYRSYHMILEIPVFFAEGKTPMRIEVQIRTIGMDFWASLEHQIRYKKDLESEDSYAQISQDLLNCAQTITNVDNQMQNIKDMIGEFKKI